MEYIWMGICIAIGIYLAPLVVGLVVGSIAIVLSVISSLFK